MLNVIQAKQLTQIKEYTEQKLKHDYSGHDVSHINRVVGIAKIILSTEPSADNFIVLASAYLHDVIDDKISENTEQAISDLENFLVTLEISERSINAIFDIIQKMSYRKNLESKQSLTLEGKIVQDADRIDAIGAIGIARTFYYGGNKKHIMHDPKIPPRTQLSEVDYKQPNTAINHFYEKLLLLKDQINTTKGKELAEERHQFMLTFLEQFNQEWKIDKIPQ